MSGRMSEGLSAVTVTPGTGAPEGSITLPKISPVWTWAAAGAAPARARARREIGRTSFMGFLRLSCALRLWFDETVSRRRPEVKRQVSCYVHAPEMAPALLTAWT